MSALIILGFGLGLGVACADEVAALSSDELQQRLPQLFIETGGGMPFPAGDRQNCVDVSTIEVAGTGTLTRSCHCSDATGGSRGPVTTAPLSQQEVDALRRAALRADILHLDGVIRSAAQDLQNVTIRVRGVKESNTVRVGGGASVSGDLESLLDQSASLTRHLPSACALLESDTDPV